MNEDNITSLNIPLIIPVILCGGSGTRLWPLSQQDKPKQLLPIVNKTILLHDTLQRISDCFNNALPHIITVTTKDLEAETNFQLNAFHPDCAQHILSEPESKNTAAAIAYASLYAKEKFGENSILWILPADHYVDDHSALQGVFDQIDLKNFSHKILTFGIPPTSPETGYGYIQYSPKDGENIKKVISFKEKPNKKTASEYINTQDHYWNSGMFLAKTKTLLNEFIDHAPETLSPIHAALKGTISINTAYQKIPNISFDYAIMENTNNAYVIEANMGWSDVGSWKNLWDIKTKDDQGNVFEGNITAQETQGCFIKSDKLMIATMGLKDVVIVENQNQILIADRKQAEYLKTISTQIKNSPTPNTHNKVSETVLTSAQNHSVTTITIPRGNTTDLHYHDNTSEKIIILSGTATIVLDNKTKLYPTGSTIEIPPKAFHKISNASDLNLEVLQIHQAQNLDAFDIIIVDEGTTIKLDKA